MSDKSDYLDLLSRRLARLSEAAREELLARFEAMIDDRTAMGMPETAAIAALGDPEALIRDFAPEAFGAAGGSDAGALEVCDQAYRQGVCEIRLHLRNADAEIVSGHLPDGTTCQIRASERGVFTWSLQDGVLTVQEAGEARRGPFARSRRVTLTLSDCAPEKLIADGYGGDLRVEGVDIGELTVLAAASGDIELSRFHCGGRTEITARSGDIRLEAAALDGDCKLEALSGDAKLRQVRARSLRLRTASGDADIEQLQVDTAAVGTGSGDVDLKGVRAKSSLLCEAESGDIDLRDVLSPEIRLSTRGGDIAARLDPCEAGYDVRASSQRGDVRIPASPTISSAPYRVYAVSVSGDISIRVG